MTSILLIFVLISINIIISCNKVTEESNLYLKRIVRQTKTLTKFTQTADELKLTKEVRINGNSCKTEHPVSVFIHSAGRSAGKYFNRRQVLRERWVKELKELNISVYFAIALNPNDTINDELKEEADKYEDIIQFGFIDAYYNLTLKSIAILRWIDKNCKNSTHFLKTDDDVIVNSRLLLDKLSEFKNGFSGYLRENEEPIRNTDDKWYIPNEVYPNKTYPHYLRGGAYMMAGNIINTLLKTIDEFDGQVFVFDDVFITGFIGEKAGIPRYSSELISYIGCGDVCPIHEKVVIYECKDDEEIKNFWSEMKNSSSEYCRNIFVVEIVGIVVIPFIVIIATILGLKFAFYKYKTKK